MKTSNKLFVISTIYVPIMMILLFYPQIIDFYTYSVPLNNVVVWDSDDIPDLDEFTMIHEKKDSTCFTTPSMNYFCYEKPRFSDNTPEGISIVRSNTTGTFGELHAEPTDRGFSYFTMRNMTQITGDTAMITFADRDGYVKNRISEKVATFEFSAVVEKFDTFVSDCNNEKNTRVTIIQYLGVSTIDDKDYFITWHTGGELENPIRCDYPQIIKHSFGHDFGI
jgi:hypothetical protein